VIAELMSEHAAMALMAGQVGAALQAGDRQRALAVCAEISALWERHGHKEELGLFAELRADPIATGTVAELEQDHRRLSAALAGAAGATQGELLSTLAELLDHANREDTDVFPTALQVVPDLAWERVAQVHRAAAGAAA
jgi:hypothetical protein